MELEGRETEVSLGEIFCELRKAGVKLEVVQTDDGVMFKADKPIGFELESVLKANRESIIELITDPNFMPWADCVEHLNEAMGVTSRHAQSYTDLLRARLSEAGISLKGIDKVSKSYMASPAKGLRLVGQLLGEQKRKGISQ